MQYTDILFRYKVWVSPRLAHTHVPPTFAPPPSVLLCAREARAPLCVVWMLAVSLCGTSIESIESMISIESVDSIESIESRESRKSIKCKESIEPSRCWRFKILSGQKRSFYQKTCFTTGPWEIGYLKNVFFGGPRAQKRVCWRSARWQFYRCSRFYRFYRIHRLYRYHRFYRFYTCATQRDRQHSHHTQRENKSTDGGGGEAAAPIGTFVRARAARAPLCVWCECWRSLCVCTSIYR